MLAFVMSVALAASPGTELERVAPCSVKVEFETCRDGLQRWHDALERAGRRDGPEVERFAIVADWEVMHRLHAQAWTELDASTLKSAQDGLRQFWQRIERFDAQYPSKLPLLDQSAPALKEAKSSLERLASLQPHVAARVAWLERVELQGRMLDKKLEAPQSGPTELSQLIRQMEKQCRDDDQWSARLRLMKMQPLITEEITARLDVPQRCHDAADVPNELTKRWYRAEVRSRLPAEPANSICRENCSKSPLALKLVNRGGASLATLFASTHSSRFVMLKNQRVLIIGLREKAATVISEDGTTFDVPLEEL